MAVAITQTANPAGVSASSNVATYSGVSIGTAASNRIVVVVVGTELASATINSVTLGGTTMNNGTQGNFSAVYTRTFYLAYPTGTTADVVVTFGANASSTQNHIAVYSVTDAEVIATNGWGSTDMDATAPLTTASITIPTNGGFLAVAAGATDTVGKTWANATEDIDEDAGAFRFTTATSTTAGSTTVTCTGGTNGEDGAMSWIIFAPSSSPTVTLSSPSDAATGISTTPDLVFTGTDNKNSNTMGNTSAQTSTGQLSNNILGAVAIAPISGSLVSMSAYLTPTGTRNVRFGVYRASDDALIGTTAETSISGAAGWYTFNLTSSVSVTAGSTYYLLGVADGSTQCTIARDAETGGGRFLAYTYAALPDPSGTAGNNFRYSVYASYAQSTDDVRYNVQVDTVNTFDSQSGSPLLNKVSGTDAGFSGTPDNSDPFASAQAVTYTVQSALNNSTVYYWRVRGLDPSGSNAYGSWATTRSFTTAAAGGGGGTIEWPGFQFGGFWNPRIGKG